MRLHNRFLSLTKRYTSYIPLGSSISIPDYAFDEIPNDAITVRILSDIHLEFKKEIPKLIRSSFMSPIHANKGKHIMGLLGDIGSPFKPLYPELIKNMSQNYDHVFVLAGNHEYYNYNKYVDNPDSDNTYYNMKDVENKINDIVCKFNNVSFLNNTSKTLYGYKFLGTTLWSNVTTQREYISKALNDYHLIYKNNRLLTVDDTNELHKEAVKWLQSEICAKDKSDKSDNKSNNVIVFTHHSPLMNSNESPTASKMYRGSRCSQAFETDLKSLIKDPVQYWGFGHTHYTTQYKFNNVTITSNQAGYDHETELYPCSYQLHCLK